MTGNLNMNGKKITNLTFTASSDNSDAVNYGVMVSKIASELTTHNQGTSSATFVKKADDTMTGDLVMGTQSGGTWTRNKITQNENDHDVSSYGFMKSKFIQLSGVTGDLAKGNHKIASLKEGTESDYGVNVSQLGRSHITRLSTNSILEYVMYN